MRGNGGFFAETPPFPLFFYKKVKKNAQNREKNLNFSSLYYTV